MKILVPCKRVSDPSNANKVKVAPGGAAVTSEGLEWKPNPFDDWAIEAALRLTENGKTQERVGEVVVVCIGSEDTQQTLRQFLAMGADRGIIVKADEAALDSSVVARVLKAVVDREKPDLVVMGKRSADSESNATGQMLAESLAWPQGTDAVRVTALDGGKKLEIGREVDGGVLTIRVTSPAVVTVSDRIVRPEAVQNGVTPGDFKYPESDSGRYASLKGIMAAKKKPVEILAIADLGVDAAPATTHGAFALPPARSGQVKFVPDVATLANLLHTEAKVL